MKKYIRYRLLPVVLLLSCLLVSVCGCGVQEQIFDPISDAPTYVDYQPNQEPNTLYSEVYEQCSPSIIYISYSAGWSNSGCNGIILSSDGYVLAAESTQLVMFTKLEAYSATKQYRLEKVRNLGIAKFAVYKIVNLDIALQPIVLADMDSVIYGQECIALGNVLLDSALQTCVSEGVISNPKNTYYEFKSWFTEEAPYVIQTDTYTSEAFHGGVMLNSDGELVGVIDKTMNDTPTISSGYVTDVTLGISCNAVKSALDDLRIPYTESESQSTDGATERENMFASNFPIQIAASDAEKQIIEKLGSANFNYKVIHKQMPIEYKAHDNAPKSLQEAEKIGWEKQDASVNIFTVNADLTAASQGSGFIIHSDGYLVTNLHVINEAASDYGSVNGKVEIAEFIYGSFENGKQSDGKTALFRLDVVAYNARQDLALLRFVNDFYPIGSNPEHRYFPYTEIGDSSKLCGGETAVIVGNGLGFGTTVTRGLISGVNVEYDYDYCGFYYLQTDTAINSGNSGGAAYYNGKVIGVASMIYANHNYRNVGWLIPSDTLKAFLRGIEGKSNSFATVCNPTLAESFQSINKF